MRRRAVEVVGTRYLPTHLDLFGPKDVVGALSALGRFKERVFGPFWTLLGSLEDLERRR